MFSLEITRYIFNGILATLIHFSILNFNVLVLGFKSVGLANSVAAFFGILASYLGNRFFVFDYTQSHVIKQFLRFCLLYGFIITIHGMFLWIWSDIYDLDFKIGFFLATFIQFALSYFGNKRLVFMK